MYHRYLDPNLSAEKVFDDLKIFLKNEKIPDE
jgi:hypothetical protein